VKTAVVWTIFVCAALLEVGGDAIIRKGLRGSSVISVVVGFIVLGCYGLVVNTVRWDFSRLLGVYVAVFAMVSVAVGRIAFKENISLTAAVGFITIILGGLIVQVGSK
jgi:small multidrug resistance family-3 protein